MKILILAPNYRFRVNWGHQLWRDEIARQHDVVFHGRGHDLHGIADVERLVREHGPFDVVTFGENPRHIAPYRGLERIDALKVCFTGDYFADKAAAYNGLIKKHKPQIVFFSSRDCQRRFEIFKKASFFDHDMETHWLPWTADIRRFRPDGVEKEYDVMCIYGLYDPVYPHRPKLQQIIRRMPYKTITGEWKSGIKHQRYIDTIRKSKIFVSVNGIYNEVTMKYTECLACRTLFITNKPKDADILGFVDGKTMVFYRDFDEMKEKVRYYLEHDAEREEIAEKGYQLVVRTLTTEGWVKKWSGILSMWFQNHIH